MTFQTRRLVALDFETASQYDHIIEIGCVELIDGKKSGREFYQLVKPKVANRGNCFEVHGLAASCLSDKPPFSKIVDEFMTFIGDASIVSHAEYYERNTLQHELERLGRSAPDRSRFICTLKMARDSGMFHKHGLEIVCRELGITYKKLRKGFHDALSDAHMTADLYLRLVDHRKKIPKMMQEESLLQQSTNIKRIAGRGSTELRNHTKINWIERKRIGRELLYKCGDVAAYIAHVKDGLTLMGH